MSLHDPGQMSSIRLGTVLVSGAYGFLGRRVLAVLANRPGIVQLLAGSRRSAPSDTGLLDLVTPFELDITSTVRVPPGVQTVIHIAGEKRDVARMQAVNEEGARRLAVASAQSGVTRFVHVSSVGVYGAPPDSGVIDERYLHAPTNVYEQTKDAGERRVREVCAEAGVECVVVRPSNVIGLVPGGGYPLRGLVHAIARGQFVWFGPQRRAWLNYVHVDDTAMAIVAAAERAPAGSEYNVNCPVPLADAVTWIADELTVPYPRRHLPRWLGRAAGELGSFVSNATGRGLPFDRARFQELTSNMMFDAAKLPRETGFVYEIGAESMFRALAGAYGLGITR
ncbi:MAG: NAD-dependent epimerase/dehydratase family protein [Steroidobacteraceae bacterium]